MKNLKLYSAVLSLVVLAMVGCSKGTTGPQGPAGPAGPAGPDNVYYSTWTAMNFAYSNNYGGDTMTISAPDLTQAIIDSGMIASYIDIPTNSGDQVVDALEFLTPIYYVGTILLFADSSTVNEVGLNGEGFRYVLIPGSVLASSSLSEYTKAQIQNMSFNQLMGLVGDKAKVVGN